MRRRAIVSTIARHPCGGRDDRGGGARDRACGAFLLFLLFCVFGVACGPSRGGSRPAAPNGPPVVRDAIVDEHAAQFDGPLADRPAGSQREFAAATYVLAHLQAAGYTPLLDPVPVKDLVRSTNVVADPPRSNDAGTVVAVAYDSSSPEDRTGAALGLWLEVARALYVRDANHDVAFVALGAEHATVGKGDLGSRRLAEFLIDRDEHPLIVTIGSISESGETFGASGFGAAAFEAAARRLGVDAAPDAPEPGAARVFRAARFPEVTVWGSVDGVARVLLDVLTRSSATASPSSR